MKKLELTLLLEGGEVTYSEDHVSGQKLLDYWNMQIDFENNAKKYTVVEVIEKRLGFIASLFSNENVTPENILKGTAPWNLMNLLDELTGVVIGVTEDDSKRNNNCCRS
ncbi:hypothetical protein AAFF39_03690 [Lactococcus garvieae]